MSPTLALTEDLLRRPSVSPEDHGCIDVICARLEPLGFQQRAAALRSGREPLVAPRQRQPGAVLCRSHGRRADRPARGLAHRSRSSPSIVDGVLYARGAADMKSGLAAMVTATERFVARHPAPRRLARLPVHQRRRRPFGRRHAQGDGSARGARREDRLVRRRRADQRRRARRHDQGRASRLALRPPDGARRAGSHRLPASRRQSSPRLRACARGTGRDALGRRQRVLPADHVPGLEHRRPAPARPTSCPAN